MIPVSLRHEDSEVLEANCTITKDYQSISGDESFYRMIGENTMFLMNKLIYPDDLSRLGERHKDLAYEDPGPEHPQDLSSDGASGGFRPAPCGDGAAPSQGKGELIWVF